jgi:hypothetical protein
MGKWARWVCLLMPVLVLPAFLAGCTTTAAQKALAKPNA